MSNKIPSDTQWQDLVGKIKAKPSVSDVIDLLYPVGSYYETSDTTFNPNTAWGGTWVEDTSGRVLVATDSGTFDTVGGTGGEETNTLTASQIPAHKHKASLIGLFVNGQSGYGDFANATKWNGINTSGNIYEAYGPGTLTTKNNENAGGSHNNLQPYIVVKRWHRTA